MRKIGILVLAAILSLSLAINPALADPGKGHAGGKGKSVSASKSNSSGSSVGKNKNDTNLSKKDVKQSKVGKTTPKKQNKVKDFTLKNQSKVEKTALKQQSKVESITSKKQSKLREKMQKKEKQAVSFSFKDTGKHWAEKAIQKTQRLGWISGYPDQSFKPDQPVTNVEVMAMAVRVAEDLELESEISVPVADENDIEEGTTPPETIEEQDEPDNDATLNEDDEGEVEDSEEIPGWARKAAQKAAKQKIINLNRFHSQVQATRAQAAVMLAKALKVEPVDVSDVSFVDQILISPDDLGYILALKEEGIISGTPSGKFNPNSAITRAEIAAMLERVADKIEQDDSNNSQEEIPQEPENSDENDSGTTGSDETGSTTDNNDTGQPETGAEVNVDQQEEAPVAPVQTTVA